MQKIIKKITSCFKKKQKKNLKTLNRKEIIRLGVRNTFDEYGEALKKLGSE